MTDESFMTDVDILCEKWHKKLDEKETLIEKLQQEIEKLKLQEVK